MHRLGVLVALTAALLPMTTLSQPQSETEDIAITGYAEENGVSITEARKRLLIQAAIGDEDKLRLRSEFESRFAGMFLAHKPDQHMVVRLVGSSPVLPRVIKTSEGDLRVVFRVDQKHTYAELKKIVSEFKAELSSIPGIQGIGVDQRTGEIVLDIAAPDKEKAVYENKKNQLEKALGAPIRFDVSRNLLVPLAKVESRSWRTGISV